MFHSIKRRVRRYWLRQFNDKLIPRFQTDQDPVRIINQIAMLLDNIATVQSLVAQIDPVTLKLASILGPYGNLEEAHRHQQFLRRTLEQHYDLDLQYLTYANQSVPFRDWLKNDEGYYLTHRDLVLWFTGLRELLVLLENVNTHDAADRTGDSVSSTTVTHILRFLFRIQDTLISIFQIHLSELDAQ